MKELNVTTHLKQHTLSAAFPSMPEEDFQRLVEDIALNGLKVPVVTHEGMVLDGWHRYTACIQAGMTPKLRELDEDEDPVAFVLSMNLSRRHLTASQRAAAVVRCADWRKVGENQHTGGSAPSAEALAEQADVSERTIRHAKEAEEAGLGDLVLEGEVSAKRAAEVAKLPKKQRAKALKEGPPKKKEPEQVDLEEAIELAQGGKDAAPEETEEEKSGREMLEEMVTELTAEVEQLEAVINAEPQLAAAWLQVKEMRAKHDALEKLYNAQRTELRDMTREASKWKRAFEELKAKGGKTS